MLKKVIYCCSIYILCFSNQTIALNKYRWAEYDIDNQAQSTPLFQAITLNNLEQVKALLKNGTNPNNYFMLHLATELGNESIAKALLDYGADINLQKSNQTPLAYACYFGHLNLVKLFLKYNAEVNLGKGTNKPLWFAVFKNHTAIVKLLLKAQADVLNYTILSPYELAINDEKENIALLLTTYGVDLNYWAEFNDNQNGNFIKSKELQQNIINAIKNQNIAEIYNFIKQDYGFNFFDIKHKKAIDYAAEAGDQEIFGLLLIFGAKADVKTIETLIANNNWEILELLCKPNNNDEPKLGEMLSQKESTKIRMNFEINSIITVRGERSRTIRMVFESNLFFKKTILVLFTSLIAAVCSYLLFKKNKANKAIVNNRSFKKLIVMT